MSAPSTSFTGIDIRPADLADPQLRALLTDHIRDMYAVTPAESVHTLDFDELAAPDMRMVAAWHTDVLLGCGAFKIFNEQGVPSAELKSMRTHESARGRGVANAVLTTLTALAQDEDIQRFYLETGVEDYFAPARSFYLRNGFEVCEPFGDYVVDPLSVFMTRTV